MKLLDRKDMNSRLASEKKLAVDQGVSLAKKVDELRRLAADEELRLRKFKDGSIAEIVSEIDAAIKRRDAILGEIRAAEAVLTELRSPLDSQWDEVRAEKAVLAEKRLGVDMTAEALRVRSMELEKRDEFLKSSEARIESDRRDASITMRRAEEALAEAHETKSRATAHAQSVGRLTDEASFQIERRESAVAVAERNLGMRSKSLDARELELNARETLLNDRTATLERSIKRLQK